MITENGSLLSCGRENQYGQLGIGSFYSSVIPYPVSAVMGKTALGRVPNVSMDGKSFSCKFVMISTGLFHSLMVVEYYNSNERFHVLYGCGSNQYGQLGKRLPSTVTSPCEIQLDTDPELAQLTHKKLFKKIDSGMRHSAVLTLEGYAILFGKNDKRQCMASSTCTLPILINDHLGNVLFEDVLCGEDHTVLLTRDRSRLYISSAPEAIDLDAHVKIMSLCTMSMNRTVLLSKENCTNRLFTTLLDGTGKVQKVWANSISGDSCFVNLSNNQRSRMDHHSLNQVDCQCGCITSKMLMGSGKDFFLLFIESKSNQLFHQMKNDYWCDIQIKLNV